MEEKKHFGVYEVIEEIGRGGISIVYKAKHPTLGKMVAIKVLSPYLSKDTAFIERFHNEAQILSSFRHQNIVYVIDFAKEGNQYYLVMDLIDGYTVKQLLQRTGALPSKIACNILKNVCTALSYTHRKGIVHRDIKSSNIMVDGNGKIMVTDFGLSKELNVDNLQDAPNEMAGTLAYISPEQLDPKLGHPDTRTDIYSLGVVFYEMVTGKLPFDENSTPVNLAYQHLKTTPPPPSQMNKDLLPKIDAMCLKMLEKKQNNRYQSAEDLLKDIEELESILLYYRAPEEKAEGSYFEVVSDEPEKPSNEIETLSEKREEVPVSVHQEEDVYVGKVLCHRYRIGRLLLKRILSSLYEGIDIQNNHPVMIQIPNESRPTFRARIEKDILTMKKVDHPGFVKFIEVVEEDGSYYVIREHIDGFTIKQLLKKQKFEIQQAIEIILQVLESLQYLHDRGIIHRDLNSDVIIVSNQGQVKIISLGFSRVEDASSVSSGEFLGVVQYTAPEQITQSKSDIRSDIYSIGILLFEMLTGALPFDSPLPVEVMDMHLKKMPRLPEEAQKTIPLNLQRILLKALAKSPEQRYQTTGEIIEELKNFLSLQQENRIDMPNIDYPAAAEADKIIKGMTELSAHKTKDFNFTIKKKSPAEGETKKVDVKQMIEDGMNNLSTSKPIAKSIPSTPPMMETTSPTLSQQAKRPPFASDPKPPMTEPASFAETYSQDTLLQKEEEKLSVKQKRTNLFWIPLVLLVLAGFLVVGWFLWENKATWIQKSNGIEVLSPTKPYQVKSFQENTFKVQTRSKQVETIKIETIDKGLNSKIQKLDQNLYMIEFYPSIFLNKASLPVSIIGLNQKGKEVVKTPLVLELNNDTMVYLVINPAAKQIQRVDAKGTISNNLNAVPLYIQEEMFLPIRNLITFFNGELSYDFTQEKLTITGLNQHTYQLYLFQDKYQIDDKVVQEKTPYIEREDIGYLPVKFLTEKMGFFIETSRDSSGNEVIMMAKVE